MSRREPQTRSDSGAYFARGRQDLEADMGAILHLKARYMSCINEKRWADLDNVLTENATVSYEDGQGRYHGRAAIVDYLRRSLELLDAVHVATDPVIRILGPDEAIGTWNLRYHWHDPWDNTSLHGSGTYHDRYVRLGGLWRIESTGFTVT